MKMEFGKKKSLEKYHRKQNLCQTVTKNGDSRVNGGQEILLTTLRNPNWRWIKNKFLGRPMDRFLLSGQGLPKTVFGIYE
jgi:hypothetical protein